MEILRRDIQVRLDDDPALVQRLRHWHHLLGWCCPAASEGQQCCLDVFIGDVTQFSGT